MHLCGKLHIFITSPDFNEIKENDLFQENEQNEHISVKLQIPMEFQKTAFYRLLYLFEILPKWLKWTDFNEIKEITDFNQFLKESLLPKNEQNEHISMKSRKLQKYQILANFQKRASYRLVY